MMPDLVWHNLLHHIRSEWWCRVVWVSQTHCVASLYHSRLTHAPLLDPWIFRHLILPFFQKYFGKNTLHLYIRSGIIEMMPDWSGIIAAAAAAPIGTFRFITLTYIVSLCPQLFGHFIHMMSVSRRNWCPFPAAENLICHLCDAILYGYAIDIWSFSPIFCNRSIITRPTTSTYVGSWLPRSRHGLTPSWG